jgi:lipopolysaccharide export system permease protein
LVAAIYVTNRLSGESELVVMRATGFSPWRMARPVLFFGLIVSLLMSVLVHVLVPASRQRLAERNDEIASNVTARFLTEGSFLHPASGVTFYVREVSPLGELKGIFLSDSRMAQGDDTKAPDRTITTYTAGNALVVPSGQGPKLLMFDGMAQTLSPERGTLTVTRFQDFAFDIGALVSQSGKRRITPDELPTGSLLAPDAETLETTGKTRANLVTEGHERLTQPLMAIVAPLIGFAALMIGEFSRFGLWRQIALAVGAVIVLYMASNAATSAVQLNDRLWPVMYAPAVLGAAITAAMLVWSGRSRHVPAEAGA